MACKAILPQLSPVRNRRRTAPERVSRQLRPGHWLPIQRGFRPPRGIQRVALATAGVRIRIWQRDRHELGVAHVTLKTSAHLGMRRHRYVRIEALRVATAFVAGLAGARLELAGGEPVRDSWRRARIRSQRTKRRQRARMCRASRTGCWLDRELGGASTKHLRLGTDRLAGRRRRCHGDVLRCGPAVYSYARGHDDEHRHCRDCRSDQKDALRHPTRAVVVGIHTPPFGGSRSTRTAHVVVSGCPDRGQKASSISRLTGAASSNDGTKS